MSASARTADMPFLSRVLWPARPPVALGIGARLTGGPCASLHLQAAATGPSLDVDPVSGDVFVGGRRVDTGGALRPPFDIRLRFRRRRNARDDVAVVYRGAGAGILDFIGVCLPAIFALDRLDPENRSIVQLPLRLARRGFVQDAMEDGLFRPRRVEIMNPRKLVSAQSVLIPGPVQLDGDFLSALWQRLSEIYPEAPNGAPEIVLCAGGSPRATSLGLKGLVIDPEALRLDLLVTALRAAQTISGPDTGELAAVALAGPGTRRVRAVAAGGQGLSTVRSLASAAGWTYEPLKQPSSLS